MENATMDMLMTTLSPDSDGGGGGGGLNWQGLLGVIAFYILILAIGIFASWRSKAFSGEQDSEDVMVAGRQIGIFVGMFTMTATWVGGGYINGTAEYVYTDGYGLVWTQAPFGYSLSLLLGGFIFAKKMREKEYVTMLDPFQEKYSEILTALMYIPALFGDIFWTAAILSALGGSLAVILGLSHTWSIIISTCVSVLYTILGGLYSVAFTDVIQLVCIFIGLWLAVPFAWLHPAVTPIGQTAHQITNATGHVVMDGWLGTFPTTHWAGNWTDAGLLLIFGGIPWQVYFQRVLSQKSGKRAQILSFAAAFGCLIMAVPAVLIGAIAKSTDWSNTTYPQDTGRTTIEPLQTLPLVLQYLTPTPVAVIGLGAISAAVMSSADSSVLSASSMFARNIYGAFRKLFCKPASEREILWVMRIAIIVVGAIAAIMGIVVKSVYGLWYLCGDLVYVILFPQLLCIVHVEVTNEAGAWAGYVLGMFFRLTGGEPLLSLPALIKYPWYDEESGYQLFPFKTLCMIITLVSTLVVSVIAGRLCPNMGKGGGKSRTYEMQDRFDKEVNQGSANPGYSTENHVDRPRGYDYPPPNTLASY